MDEETFMFECQQCGECCKKPGFLTDGDFDRISSGLNVDKETFYQMCCDIYDNLVGLRPKINKANGHCVFYRDDNGLGVCIIHDIKPLNCKQAPMKISLDPSSPFSISPCSGVGNGPTINANQYAVENGIDELTGFLIKYAVVADISLPPEYKPTFMEFAQSGDFNNIPQDIRKAFDRIARDIYSIS
jgi:Fe-S-cluster containining protein